MANPILGKAGQLYISTDGSTGVTYALIGELDTLSITIDPKYADISQMGDMAKREIPSIVSLDGSASGLLTPSDAGQTVILACQLAPALAWVKYLWDGTNGRKCLCAWKSIKTDSKQGGDAAKISFSFEAANGAAPVVAP